MSIEPKNILLTGGTGFLGQIIRDELARIGYDVTTLGPSVSNVIRCDLSVEAPVLPQSYTYVVHNAGKAHVIPQTESDGKEFFDVNVQGTKNLLGALDRLTMLPKAIVFISSIAVYGCQSGEYISEEHALTACDPYGRSKIEAETLLQNWSMSKGVHLTILRLPLVAGVRPTGNLGAMIKGLRKGFYLRIDGGKARKSIVMGLDVARTIPIAFEHPGVYNLTDGHNPSFYELEEIMVHQLGVKSPKNLSIEFARVLGKVGDVMQWLLRGRFPITTSKIEKIISTLTFDDRKARKVFGWSPKRVIDVFRIE